MLLDAIRSALHAAYLHTDHPVRDSEVLIDELGLTPWRDVRAANPSVGPSRVR